MLNGTRAIDMAMLCIYLPLLAVIAEMELSIAAERNSESTLAISFMQKERSVTNAPIASEACDIFVEFSLNMQSCRSAVH